MKRALALTVCLALCLALAGCWEGEEEDEEEFWTAPQEQTLPDEEPEAPAQHTAFTLPYLVNRSLDPITASDAVQQAIGALLYEGLFALDGRFVPHEALCESYSVNADATQYTFTLRGGVTFSDGSALGVNDVLTSYRRAAVSTRYGARFANVASTRAVNGALVVTLTAPDRAFPALLDIPIVKSGTEKNPVPLGTGPYVFATDSDGACLLRNDNWTRGERPPLERIALVSAKDVDSAVYLFSAGSAHLLNADLLSESSASALGNAAVTDAPTATMLYLGFRCGGDEEAVTGDPALRRALNAAIDRDALCASVLAQHALPAQFPIPPVSPLYPAQLEVPFARGAYREALSALEIPEEGLALTLLVNEENPFKTALAEHLCRAFTGETVTVTPRVLPWSDYLAALESGDFDLYLGELRLTADWDLSPLLASYGRLNYGGYADAQLDAVLAALPAEQSSSAAEALCAFLAQDAPILPLAFKSVSTLTPEGMCEGLNPTAADPFHNFAAWTIRMP